MNHREPGWPIGKAVGCRMVATHFMRVQIPPLAHTKRIVIRQVHPRPLDRIATVLSRSGNVWYRIYKSWGDNTY